MAAVDVFFSGLYPSSSPTCDLLQSLIAESSVKITVCLRSLWLPQGGVGAAIAWLSGCGWGGPCHEFESSHQIRDGPWNFLRQRTKRWIVTQTAREKLLPCFPPGLKGRLSFRSFLPYTHPSSSHHHISSHHVCPSSPSLCRLQRAEYVGLISRCSHSSSTLNNLNVRAIIFQTICSHRRTSYAHAIA